MKQKLAEYRKKILQNENKSFSAGKFDFFKQA